MIQLFLHLLGDYFLQNDWMAVNKSKWSLTGYISCIIHCMLYAIPFGIYYHSIPIALWVYITHLLVDKFTLAQYWTKLINWNWSADSVYGFDKSRPVWLTVWLHIIRDNSIHLVGNYLIIKYLIG